MTITELTNTACGESLQGNVCAAINETNSVLAGCGVHFIFRGSTIDNVTGLQGLRWAITRVLTQAGPAGMFAEQIMDIIRNSPDCAALNKYPDQTFSDNLCTVLKGAVVCWQLTGAQDSGRNSADWQAMRVRRNAWRKSNGLAPIDTFCKRPRKLWALVHADK